MCKLATVSCSQVDDRVLHFDLIIDNILNSQFSTILPASFKKVNGNPNIVVTSKDDDGKIGGNKCRKKIQESGNIVKNAGQLKEFKMASGESWDKIFWSQCPKECPNFSKDCKMCARWHIKGDCFDTCPCAFSHIPGSKITPKQKETMLTQNNWINWFINHPTNEDGNRNLNSFINILGAGTLDKEKLRSLVEEIDTVILSADAYKNIMILHNPKNFSGTRLRPANKVACMIGLGNQASYVNVNLKSALTDCRIVVPSITEL
jgi:hypothetical protein